MFYFVVAFLQRSTGVLWCAVVQRQSELKNSRKTPRTNMCALHLVLTDLLTYWLPHWHLLSRSLYVSLRNKAFSYTSGEIFLFCSQRATDCFKCANARYNGECMAQCPPLNYLDSRGDCMYVTRRVVLLIVIGHLRRILTARLCRITPILHIIFHIILCDTTFELNVSTSVMAMYSSFSTVFLLLLSIYSSGFKDWNGHHVSIVSLYTLYWAQDFTSGVLWSKIQLVTSWLVLNFFRLVTLQWTLDTDCHANRFLASGHTGGCSRSGAASSPAWSSSENYRHLHGTESRRLSSSNILGSIDNITLHVTLHYW
jgi:hypothetical protein